MKFRAFCYCLFFICSHATADDQNQPGQGNSSSPTEGINKFLKGLTDSINGAVSQLQAKPQGDTPQQPTSQSASPSEKVTTTQTASISPSKTAPILSATELNGIFAKHPYDGTSKSQYPKVAITVTDWAPSDCWRARAKIWWSAKKSQQIHTFRVCWHESLARSADNAVNYQLFMRQMALGSSGNIRTEGPKPPMMAYPMPDPFGVANYAKGQQAISFIQQILMETGWQAGAPTNIWVVKYDDGN